GHVAGGDWVINVTGSPTSTPYGGRKTNGMVITDPLTVLYNGPREYIAQATNHIYDNDGTYTWPVVDLIITMIFDKVSKEVILYKDVKTTIDKLNLWGKLDVQLSDREEYDMGSASSDNAYSSYAHFYEEAGWTSMTPSWSIAQNLTADNIEHQVGSTGTVNLDGSETFTLNPPNGYPVSEDYMKVYVNGVFQVPSLYTVSYGPTTYVTLITAPSSSSIVQFNYKYVFKSTTQVLDGVSAATSTVSTASDPSLPSWANEYDYAQVISSDNQYVAWAAFWPPTSSQTVDGIENFLQPLYNVHTDTLSSAPKRSPLIIGQWDVAMDPSTFPMFRAVEVKGICNDHNAQDPQETLSTYRGTQLDIEAQYQLDSVFAPYNLREAITENLNTWVDYYTVTANDILRGYLYVDLSHSPVHYVYPWETYDSQSERVLVNGVLQYPSRSVAANELDTSPTYQTPTYELYTEDGVGYIYFPDSTIFTKGDVIKVIYATETCNYESGFSVTSNTLTPGGENSSFDFGSNTYWPIDAWSWVDYLNVQHDITIKEFDGSITPPDSTPTGNTTWTYYKLMDWEAKDFTVFKEDTTSLEISAYDFSADTVEANGTVPGYDMTIQLQDFRIKWQITGPEGTWFNDLLDVMVSKWDFNVYIYVYVNYVVPPTGSPYYTTTATLSFEPKYGSTLYKEEIPGSYTWGIVGSNAKSVDSAGLSMISAALKDKEVEYGVAGADINATDPTLQMPYVFSKMSTGTSTLWSPYYYSTTDLRTGLRDDWDPAGTDTQISRANLVGSGGPLVNMLAYYGNDFTSAFYGISQFTPYGPWNGAIVALSCWSDYDKAFFTSASVGYAVISTFEDLNGTTGLLVYGVWGRDTYYAASYFYQDLIQEFQSFPWGATSIVLQITYNTTTLKPKAFSVVEVLGTISETGIDSTCWPPYVWGVSTPIKGGIHPDP
ncbi:MAG: hypothetical protein WCD81_03280, partial [Candidatus Bathyarchaeia archaeon]